MKPRAQKYVVLDVPVAPMVLELSVSAALSIGLHSIRSKGSLRCADLSLLFEAAGIGIGALESLSIPTFSSLGPWVLNGLREVS